MTDNRTILVVDDEPAILETYEDDLCPGRGGHIVQTSRISTWGGVPADTPPYRLVKAGSGEDALRIVEDERTAGRRIAAGFFDMKMPGGIDGLETVRLVRRIDPDILCCVTTAYQDWSIDEINRLFPGHEDEWDYIAKPFTQAEIRQKARNLVSSWNRRRREESLQAELRALTETLAERVELRTSDLRDANANLERKAAELELAFRALSEMKSQLFQQERLAAVGQLASGVAHEINNPAAFVTTNLQTIQALLPRIREAAAATGSAEAGGWRAKAPFEIPLEELPDMLGDCLEGMRRITAIVSQLRSFGRIDADVPVPVDVKQAMDKALRLLDPQLGGRVRVIRRHGGTPVVLAREPEIVQSFMNLIQNSLLAFPVEGADGRIEIAIEEVGDRVRVAITDNGSGIAPELLGKVFNPFFTTRGPGRGMGLGLSVVHDVVTKQGGKVDIASQPGTGTTVTMEFAAAGPASSRTSPNARS